MLSQLLLVIPHDHHDLVNTPGDAIRRRHVRVAMEFIDEHAGEPITGADVARAACVSVRALQAGFQEELGMSPTVYLPNTRLDRARADLLAGPADVSLSEVASRWGFWHLGRFAQHYRRKFGLQPSETARERR